MKKSIRMTERIVLYSGGGAFIALLNLRSDTNTWGIPGGSMELYETIEETAIRELKEETGIENVNVLKDDIFSLETICVNGHIKRGKYVSSHLHLNLTYLLEVDEKEELKIKEDENSGVRWIDIEDIDKYVTEPWMKDRVYSKLREKIKG